MAALPSAAPGCEVHRDAPVHNLCLEEAGTCAADHPSGVTCLGTHTQGRSGTGISSNSLKNLIHMPRSTLLYGEPLLWPWHDYITAQAGDAITLWLNCILTVIRHRGEERLPGKQWPQERDRSYELLKENAPA